MATTQQSPTPTTPESSIRQNKLDELAVVQGRAIADLQRTVSYLRNLSLRMPDAHFSETKRITEQLDSVGVTLDGVHTELKILANSKNSGDIRTSGSIVWGGLGYRGSNSDEG